MRMESTIESVMELYIVKDSLPIRKVHDCYQDAQKFHSNASDARRLQCADVNKPLQKVLRRVYTLYTYLRFDFMSDLYLQYKRAQRN